MGRNGQQPGPVLTRDAVAGMVEDTLGRGRPDQGLACAMLQAYAVAFAAVPREYPAPPLSRQAAAELLGRALDLALEELTAQAARLAGAR